MPNSDLILHFIAVFVHHCGYVCHWKCSAVYTVSQKRHPDVFSYNSRKYCQIFIIFGRNITEKASNQKMLYFST